MNKHTLLIYLLLLCSMYSLHAQNIDLELSLSTPNPNPANYSHVPLTYTISNEGTATATNIRVDVRVCNPLFNVPSPFNNPTQIVNSTSPPHSTSAGTYDKTTHAWFIPSLAAGSSATLNLTIFTLTEEERTILGAVSEVDQTDVDSSPAILNVCNTSEDDEAELVLNSGTTPLCDVQNLAWVDARIADEEALCDECIDFIKIYEVDGVFYVGFIADNENCADALTTIYNCDGTVYCQDGGITGLSECENWWNQNPLGSYQLWTGTCFNVTGFGFVGAAAWFDYNGNGILEDGVDNPLPGMLVQLEDSNNNIVASKSTNTPGHAFFYDIIPGTYRLVFEGVDGAVPTAKLAPGSGDWTSSAINPDGKTDFFTLEANQSINYMGGGFYDSSLNTSTDLELSLEVSNTTPNAYTHLPLTYTIENTGTSPANNVRIFIGACVNNFWSFGQSSGIVHSSTIPVTSAGTYSKTSQVWEISNLAPGTSATLDLSVFMLTDEERPLVGQIVSASPNDIDSNPDNMTNCIAVEDDEVRVILNGSEGCICPAFDDPVCGSDGVTYPNACEAECAGIFAYTPGACSTGGDGIDLELAISSPTANPNIYTHVPLTYTITNTGTSTATNVQVEARVCNPTISVPSVFRNGVQIVNSSSPEAVTSTGTYDKLPQVWTIPSLAAGSSATLTLSVFVLTEEERTILGEVIFADQEDIDSELDNRDGCNTTEDDEAQLIFNEGTPPLCDYENLDWVDDRIADTESLCEDCIKFIGVYKIGNTTYIGFVSDNGNCNSPFNTVYNCDGTEYCVGLGPLNLPGCDDFWNSNPSLITKLWERNDYCDGVPSASISTLAWVDHNGDGIREETIDNVLPNVTVYIEDQNGQIAGTGQTNANGQVSFYPLNSGTYRLVYEVPEGTQPTLKNAPGSTPSTDSEINPDGTSDYLTVESGGIINNVGAGFYSGAAEDDTDLELSLTVSDETPSAYTHVTLTYTLTNTSETTATNIGVGIGVCPVVPGFRSFTPENGIVKSSSPSPSTSAGIYYPTSQNWELEELAAGASATLNVTVFMLTDEERFLTASVLWASPHDIDSTPGNFRDCEDLEDDELKFALNGNEDCICPTIDAPVCGSDGMTYPNACEAECAGVFDYTPGECGGVCTCEAIVNPVCGSDGTTYQNACLAECAGIFDYISGECPTGDDGVDLELEIIPPSSYAIYTNMTFQVRVFNNGTTNAENVVVDAPLPDGFVHSSNSASSGDYDLFREKWNVGTIKVGETAVLDLNLFALTSDDITAYAQVAAAEPNDIDSTPGNGTCLSVLDCTANEDDEDAITISSNFQDDNGSNAFIAPSTNRDIDIKTMYPNIATDKIHLFVDSKLPVLNIRVYNMQGHELLQKKYQDTEGFQRLQLDISELPTGTYFIRFDGTLGRETLRFVKMRM